MAENKTPQEKCIEACDDCSMQCSGSAFQGEMMGEMELASSLGRLCAEACTNLSRQLKDGDASLAEACATACRTFIPEAKQTVRHLASFEQAAIAAQTVIKLISELAPKESVMS